jgi:protein-L-isoaspartate(D-aspartate) O-methyltransferase
MIARWTIVVASVLGTAAPACRRQPAEPAAALETVAQGEAAASADEGTASGATPLDEAATTAEAEKWRAKRERMVERQLEERDISDPDVLRAMGTVPRERFVPENVRDLAYADGPLPIGMDQTISQPYIVALMTQLAEIHAGDRVLEIGTGSGYQAAVLAELGAEVYSIEIIEPLAARAGAVLETLGYGMRVHVRVGDGYFGWPEHAPYAAVLITAAPPEIPQPLLDELAPGGRLVAPVGDDGHEELVVVEKDADGRLTRREVMPVSFVPMTGEAQR